MAGGDDAQDHAATEDPPQRAPDPFLRFLIPAPKPRRAAPTALLQPPHRLIAPPELVMRPEERLFIVPPTRPDWLPPPPRSYQHSPSSSSSTGAVARPRPPVPPPPPPPSPSRRYHSSSPSPRPRPRPPFPPPTNDPWARNAGRFARQFAGVHVNGNARRGRSPVVPLPHDGGARFLPVPLPHDVGFQRPKAAAAAPHKEKEKKAWVAVQRKAESGARDEDRAAALSEGYSGGDEGSVEAEDVLQPQGKGEQQEDDDANRRLLLIDQQDDDVESSLPTDGTLDCSGRAGGGDRPSEVTPGPDQVPRLQGRMRRPEAECRHDIDTFTPGLLALYESLKPSEEHRSKQKQLVDSLAKSVSKEWPNAQMHLYGSCANSFGTSHSDVDVCLEMETGTQDAIEVLVKLADVLRTDGFENVEAITSARVPIVRMSDPGSGFSCDICINNLLAVANTKLLKDYAQIDQRLLQLAFLVKHWAKQRGVNETYRGTLSSYAYVLMCINFLQQCEPKILPCLQAMEPTYKLTVDGTECAYFDKVDQLQGFGADNKASVAELLWGFFHYWASQHHYKRDVISVRLGKTISKQEKRWTTRVGNDRHLVCIEDPFEVSHDLGRVVDRQTIRILREEMERAAVVLQHDDDPCVTLFEPYGCEN
ncbi:UTP:RNA uridylyltransferase 1 [Sorghum bicolor]|uniref:RNA uridylyltransferase n=1 Tax=Sorghum bicolor TaxID=4558 RepID=A0A1Z5RKJ6_SORBI|nr:UTP:RNA uridylyltransferase 1 [Sorghum bicolor]OQU84248.1 hypothetical protein SORBI_3004G019700 [Sorghum bicolor]|eukprot:XP_002451420.1 UTP:RNA uridylyltransferase 1 [Sorghum bicolor]